MDRYKKSRDKNEVIEGSEDFSRCDISKLKGDTVEINIFDWIEKGETK